MKLSLKLQDQNYSHQQPPPQYPLLVRAKIPLTIFGLPFLSAVSAIDHPSDVSLSLRSNFPSGPSLKLSYNPTSTTTAAANPPLTLTLKSGVGVFGSPNNSPLIISANFSFSPQNPNLNPTFSLHFRPRLGSFSLRKTTSSDINPNPSSKSNGDVVDSFGFVSLGSSPLLLKESTVESASKDSIFSGILVMAKTELPVVKRVAVNFRWGVNLSSDFGKQLPYLRVNKVTIERTEEVQEEKKVKEKNLGDFEMLKGMYSWMRKELSDLQKENRVIKHALGEIRLGNSMRNDDNHVFGSGGGKKLKPVPVVENSGGFEQWRSKKNGGEEVGRKEGKKNASSTSDVESELQRAIKAASSSS